MHCTLLVPDLLRRPDPDRAPHHDPHLPALTRLLARARCRKLDDAPGLEGWLCGAFSVERQHDWPVAPLTLAADGGDPGDAYWLRCDPVHLRTQRRQLLLTDSGKFAPTPDEARALIATLNAHFERDGLVFHAPHPSRWYLRVGPTPALSTQALAEAAGNDADCRLPAGDDSLHWHRMINEMQMVLHAHPVNQAREAAGQLAINSVWLWGGGVMPSVHGRPYTKIWSSDELALALASACGIPASPLPETAVPLMDATADDSRRPLAILPQLRTAMRDGNDSDRNAALNALEKNWFAPLYSALRRRRLTELSLVATGAQWCRRYDVAGADLWKFWRPVRALRHHV